MRDVELYVWIVGILRDQGQISLSDVEAKYGGDSKEVLFATEFLERYDREGIVRKSDEAYAVADRRRLREKHRELTEAEGSTDVESADSAIVVSIPSSLRLEWHQRETTQDVPVVSLQGALREVLTNAEESVSLSVPYFELDGFNALESEFLALADDDVELRVLTREVLTSSDGGYSHSRKVKALRELVERYQARAETSDLVEIRDFYRQIGPEAKMLDRSIHAKLAIGDEKAAYVGSGEVRDSSFNLNGEAGYFTRDGDAIAGWKSFFEFFWAHGEVVSREFLIEQTE